LVSRALAFPLERHNQRSVRWSDGIVLCSVDDRDFVLDVHKANPERLLALAPGIAPDFLSELPPEDNNRWSRLLYAGSFMPQKAPEIVAQVFRMVIEARPQVSLTWVCQSGDHDRARRLLGSQAAARVSFLDWMPRDELRRLFDRHGVFLFPSYFEGFSLTFLEAMARGLCVIGTKIDGMRQVLRHGIDGFIFERGAAEAMGRQAVELLADPESCRQVSTEARKTAARFTWKRTAEEFVTFCDRLLQLKR
jgi:glycosyltransferase involved in cell wall biosynthesis